MNSLTTEEFWKCYGLLPDAVKKEARKAYKQFVQNPYYPGLRFKRIHSSQPIFSIRITRNHRAIGVQKGNDIVWFWIGSHSNYSEICKKYR
jgi:hypothetical protein